MKIFGFYHVLLINHWERIVTEQLGIMNSSGLYNVVEKIHVGCLGAETEKIKLENIFASYPKIEISYHSLNPLEYEYATLRILKQVVDESIEPFYGFYFHTKGVTWSATRNIRAFVGGTYWRGYMNFYVLKRWMENIARLDAGCDTCGVKLLQSNESPAKKLHYSGTFFWFKSEYAKRLPEIDTLNTSDRMEAEMWICSAQPNAATLCQMFVDYRAKGQWKDPY